MAVYEIKLVKQEEVAEGTMMFSFEKPTYYEFKAGQNNDVSLINPPETDAEGNTRAFSLASAPFEGQLQIATRMRDTAFKRVLKAMPIGTVVKLDGPMGDMTLQNDTTRPAAFLAGGIGITPFLSLVRQAAHDKLPHKIFLFYSNRRPEDAAFLQELMDLQRQNPNYTLVGTMTDMATSTKPWTGETGYIDATMLKKYLGDILKPVYYLAGPPAMTGALRKMLVGAGVNSDYIKSEEFTGY